MVNLDFHQVDFHTHTMESPSVDKEIPVIGLIREAEKQNLKAIAITDHWKEKTNPDIFLKERKIIEQNKNKFDLKVYLSAEMEMWMVQEPDLGSPVNIEKYRETLECMDFVGITFHLGLPESMKGLLNNRHKYIEYACKKLTNLIKCSSVDLILHGTTCGLIDCKMFGLCDKPSFEYVPERWLDKIAEAAAHYNTKLELTEGTVGVIEDYELFIKKLVDAGVKLTVGSDFHYFEHSVKKEGEVLPGNTRKAVELLKRCGANSSLLWLPSKE